MKHNQRSDFNQLTDTLAVKLGSIVIHAEEGVGPKGHSFDLAVLRTLTADGEVREWLDSFPPGYLPVKR